MDSEQAFPGLPSWSVLSPSLNRMQHLVCNRSHREGSPHCLLHPRFPPGSVCWTSVPRLQRLLPPPAPSCSSGLLTSSRAPGCLVPGAERSGAASGDPAQHHLRSGTPVLPGPAPSPASFRCAPLALLLICLKALWLFLPQHPVPDRLAHLSWCQGVTQPSVPRGHFLASPRVPGTPVEQGRWHSPSSPGPRAKRPQPCRLSIFHI